MPDLFHGNPVPLNRGDEFDFTKWLHGSPDVPGHPPDRVAPVVESVLKEMRGPLGCKKIGGVAYCFGALSVLGNLQDGKLDAGFIAHPSFVEADDFKSITKPLSIAAAGWYHPDHTRRSSD